MSGYGVLRLIHGYWRWMVLVSGLVALVRSGAAVSSPRAWRPGDEQASRRFVAALDIQVLLGLMLYFAFSPFWSAVHESFHLTLKNETTRFFGLEHETAMLVAFVAVHVGRVRVRRETEAAAKHRALFASTLLFFALALWAIPWPWRAIGRPLFRLSW